MTMDTPWTALFPAFVVGLSIAAPVGPIGLLTIQRTLERGRLAGLATGLGAATADACYGAIGAYGVHWLVGALVALRLPLAIGGGLLLAVPPATVTTFTAACDERKQAYWQIGEVVSREGIHVV